MCCWLQQESQSIVYKNIIIRHSVMLAIRVAFVNGSKYDEKIRWKINFQSSTNSSLTGHDHQCTIIKHPGCKALALSLPAPLHVFMYLYWTVLLLLIFHTPHIFELSVFSNMGGITNDANRGIGQRTTFRYMRLCRWMLLNVCCAWCVCVFSHIAVSVIVHRGVRVRAFSLFLVRLYRSKFVLSLLRLLCMYSYKRISIYMYINIQIPSIRDCIK